MSSIQIYEKAVKRKNDTPRVAAMVMTVVGYVCFDLVFINESCIERISIIEL